MQLVSQNNLQISDLVQALKEGQTFVYPTETCYGLGCDALNVEAVQKIFRIKKRDDGKPVLIVFPDIEMAMEYIDWNETLETIASKYWPGPLTVVVDDLGKGNFPKGVRGNDGTIAFRISSHPFVQEITKAFEGPLVSTSANVAGEENPYTAEDIQKRFSLEEVQPDIIIDANTLPPSPPSTVVKIENGQLVVLRQGSIYIEE